MAIGAGVTIYNLLSKEEKVEYKDDPLALEKALKQYEFNKKMKEMADRDGNNEPKPTKIPVFKTQTKISHREDNFEEELKEEVKEAPVSKANTVITDKKTLLINEANEIKSEFAKKMISMHDVIKIFESSLNLLKDKSIVDYNLAVNEIKDIKKAQIQLRDNYLKDIEEINEKIKKVTGFSLEGLRLLDKWKEESKGPEYQFNNSIRIRWDIKNIMRKPMDNFVLSKFSGHKNWYLATFSQNKAKINIKIYLNDNYPNHHPELDINHANNLSFAFERKILQIINQRLENWNKARTLRDLLINIQSDLIKISG